jgi:hypothetical protein
VNVGRGRSLTVFTTTKPFSGAIATQQRNAIRSWCELGESVSVMLLGDDGGAAEAARDLGVLLITDIERNDYGTPLISSLFKTASASSTAELLCYVNADIILMPDFMRAIDSVRAPRFLVCGQRWDVDMEHSVDFGDPSWRDELMAQARQSGKLHAVTGMDYFAFPRGSFDALPPFTVGRLLWDNWLVFHARTRGIAVVDATHDVLAVHQNHEYKHVFGGVLEGPEVGANRALAEEMLYPFTIADATHRLVGGRVVRARSAHKRVRFVEGQIAVGLRTHARLRGYVRWLGRAFQSALTSH